MPRTLVAISHSERSVARMKPGRSSRSSGGNRSSPAREEDEVGARFARLFDATQDPLAVPVEVADDRVDLREGQPRESSLAVFASAAKTYRIARFSGSSRRRRISLRRIVSGSRIVAVSSR